MSERTMSTDHLHRTQPNAIAVLNEVRDESDTLHDHFAVQMQESPESEFARGLHEGARQIIAVIGKHQCNLTKEVEAVEAVFEAKRPAPEQREPELEARCRDD